VLIFCKKIYATDLGISRDEYSRQYLRNLLFHDTGSLLWILPSDYFSTDSKQYLADKDSYLSWMELINKCNQNTAVSKAKAIQNTTK